MISIYYDTAKAMNFIRKVASINIDSIKVNVKISLWKEFVLNNDFDVVFLQEVAFDDFSFLPSHEAFVNRNGTSSGTAILVRKSVETRDCLKCPSGRIISIVVDNINFVNFYGHAGSQHRAERDDLFEIQTVKHMGKTAVSNTIIGGDFNCILEDDDTRGNFKNISRGLKTLTNLFDLKDVELKLKGQNKQFTFFRNDSASRIDRFYASKQILTKISKFDTRAIPFSDHHAIFFNYQIDANQRFPAFGRGYWKIKDFLLQDDELSLQFSEEYDSLRARRKYVNNFAEWWCFDVKNKIKQFYNSKFFEHDQRNRAHKEVWYNRLKELENRQINNEDVNDEMFQVKSLIVNAENERLQSICSGFQPNTILEAEKMGIYQVSKFVKRHSHHNRVQLKNSDGHLSDHRIRIRQKNYL